MNQAFFSTKVVVKRLESLILFFLIIELKEKPTVLIKNAISTQL